MTHPDINFRGCLSRWHYLRAALLLSVIGVVLLWPIFCRGESAPRPNEATCSQDYPRLAFAVLGKGQISMLPTIKPGDILLLDHIPYADLKVGDIVLRKESWVPLLVCHRIVKRSTHRVVTKGDNNKEEDYGWMTPKTYAGRVKLIIPMVTALRHLDHP